MAEILQVSKSGYYDWLGREASSRDQENQMIYHDVLELFLASRMSSGARRIAKRLSQMYGRPINRKRIARIMRETVWFQKEKRNMLSQRIPETA